MSELERLARERAWRIGDRATLADGVWRVRAAGAAESYPEDGNEQCRAVEDQSPWFRHRNLLIERLLTRGPRPSALWDVGAGNGVVARHLQGAGYAVVAVEPGPVGAAHAAARGVHEVVCGRLEDLALPDASVPAIGCFDVIEHLPDAARLLREVRRVLAPGAPLVLSVPAHPWLWSEADDLAGHQLRFTRRGLIELLAAHGLTARHVERGMFSLVAPLFATAALPYRLGRRRRAADVLAVRSRELAGAGAVTSAALTAVLAAERRASRRVPLPLGTSLLGVFAAAP